MYTLSMVEINPMHHTHTVIQGAEVNGLKLLSLIQILHVIDKYGMSARPGI